jgi:hypothetical protein
VARGVGPAGGSEPGQHARTIAATPLITFDDARASDLTAYIGSSAAERRGPDQLGQRPRCPEGASVVRSAPPRPSAQEAGRCLRPGVRADWSGLAQRGRLEGRLATHRYYGNPHSGGRWDFRSSRLARRKPADCVVIPSYNLQVGASRFSSDTARNWCGAGAGWAHAHPPDLPDPVPATASRSRSSNPTAAAPSSSASSTPFPGGAGGLVLRIRVCDGRCGRCRADPFRKPI